MVIGDERALDRRSDAPVVPDGGGQGEQSGGDAGVDPGEDAAAVLFEGELAFRGVEDRLDPLPDAGELAEPDGLVLAVRAHQVGAEFVAEEGPELGAGEALVAQDDVAGPDQLMVGVGDQQSLDDFPLAEGWGWPIPRRPASPRRC